MLVSTWGSAPWELSAHMLVEVEFLSINDPELLKLYRSLRVAS